MKNYEKPIAIVGETMNEGIYAASGCYIPQAYIHQKPETGRGDYRIQVDAKHNANHSCSEQILTLVFNMDVTYVSSNGTLFGSGTGRIIKIRYGYHNNAQDSIGLGDVIVTADPGLYVTSVSISDNG